MISFKHQFTSAKADGPDSTQVQPSNWNAEHVLTMATARLLGRSTAGTGVVEEISIHSSLMLSAGVLALATNPTVAGNLIVSGTLAVGGTSQFTGAAQFLGGMTVTGAVGVGGTPAATAMFDIQSTTKGFLFPRLTTTQRDAIVSPATGLVIYNTTDSRMEIYTLGSWGPVAPVTVLSYASQPEAEAGVDNTKLMTPLRTAQAIDAALTAELTTSAVLSLLASSSVGAVGTYAWLGRNGDSGALVAGTNYAGSSLVYAGVVAQNAYIYNTALRTGGATPAGTWRAMGTADSGSDPSKGTLFLRIS